MNGWTLFRAAIFLAAFTLLPGAGGGLARGQETPPETGAPAPEGSDPGGITGRVHVVADEESNTLMIYTAPGNIERVRAIIAELDRPVPQVLIKALVAEVSYSKELDLGTEFSIFDLDIDGRRVFTRFGQPTEGMGFGLLERDVTATLSALQKVGSVNILSRPYILAGDNQQAEIVIGDRVPIITASRVTDTGQVINTIQYQDIGIILRVTPQISPGGRVNLEVRPEISALGENIAISDTAYAPVIATRWATSRVTIPDGQVIVIGGLLEDRQRRSVRKVPLLGDIPLLGLLFRRTVDEERQTELLIFLSPHIARDPESMAGFSAAEAERTRALDRALEPGLFESYIEDLGRGPE